MDQNELQYKLEAVDRRLKIRKVILKNYQEALLEGITDYKLEQDTIAWVKKLNTEIATFERDRKRLINKHEIKDN